MRNVRLWRELLGVERRTVIEGIEFARSGPTGRSWWWPGSGREVGCRVGVVAAVLRRRGMTAVRVGAGGGAWIGARCRWCWRPMRRG